MPLTFWKICLSGRKGEFEVLFWIWLLKAIIIDWYIVCHNMEVQMLRVCWEYICCPMFCFFVLISMIWVSLYYVFVKSCLSLLILSLFSIHFSLFFGSGLICIGFIIELISYTDFWLYTEEFLGRFIFPVFLDAIVWG